MNATAIDQPRFTRGSLPASWRLRGGPEDVLLAKRGGWYEKQFTGHRTLRSGEHITYPWSKTVFQDRWHLVDADGACRPECRRPGYASCGSIRLGVMKELLVRFLAERKEVADGVR